MFKSIEEVEPKFAEQGYIADRTLATTIYLAASLGKPVFLEGEPGVGKTEVAKVMAEVLETNLIRLQCYEGLDANTALYEWNYPRQMLELRLEEARGMAKEEIGRNIFSEDYLLKRPLLSAIQNEGEKAPVLLIDEVDRCVAGDTLVFTPAGFKLARNVRVGDRVVGFNPAAFDRSVSRVRKVTVHCAERLLRIYAGGRILEVTPEHRMVQFDEEGNYRDTYAQDIKPGDLLPVDKWAPTPETTAETMFELKIASKRGLVLGRVTRIEEVKEPQEVYDFTLDGDPYFVGNGLVTHNCDEEFEAFLLEILSDFQITIPEIGTIQAEQVPFVVLTSNRTRELHDALKRRCLYLWIDYPTFEKEMDIVASRVSGIREELSRQVCGFMQLMRTRDFYKRPGVAETIDWSLALMALDIEDLDPETVDSTLGCILKYKEDIEKLQEDGLSQIIDKARMLRERSAAKVSPR